jgi:site-specific DNA recombinase
LTLSLNHRPASIPIRLFAKFMESNSRCMTRSALYARVSTDLQQKEGTIESQLATLRRQIAQAGHELVKEYIDDGYTGTLLTRPGLEQMRSDLKTDLFDAIYFLAADRIARDAAYQSIIVGELVKHGKQIIINGVDYKNNPENKVTLTILGAVAEFERAKIIERMMRGKLHRLSKGEMIGGLPPFGYVHVSKTSDTPRPGSNSGIRARTRARV